MKQLFTYGLYCFACVSILTFSDMTFGEILPQSDSGKILDRGKFIVFSNGAQVGTESFQINSDYTSDASDELSIGGQSAKFSSQTVLDPVTMRARRLVIDYPNVKLVFDISGAEVKLTGTKEATAKTDPDAVILENNLWYQYFFLVCRFDNRKGRIQQFSVLVPSIMQTLPLTVELKGSIGPLPTLSSKLNWYRLTVATALVLDVTTDSAGKLVYVGVPSQHADVIREEHVKSLAELRKALTSTPASTTHLDYSAPEGAPFVSESLKISLSGYSLGGTLLLPKACGGPCPAVVMITGSGQQTRDEPLAIPGLEKYRPFRQIAEALAKYGIAVLRVDDRGVGESTGLDTLATATTSSFAEDTRAQVAYLRTRKDIDPERIALVGHSEGGSIATMVAASDPRVAAIVLVAGAGKSGADISLYQISQVLDAVPSMSKEEKDRKLNEQREYIAAVREGRDLSKYPAEGSLPWTLEYMKSDPLSVIRKVRQPILILQGALDRQITSDQATLLEAAARSAGNKDVTVRVFPSLNHLFLPAKTGAVSEYPLLPSSALPDDVVAAITDWLRSRFRILP